MKIRSFEEYNAHRKGKQRWVEPHFDMPRSGKTTCGLCRGTFTASDYFFLLCKPCVKRNVEVETSQEFSDVVYGLYSMTDELLYIGVTNNPVVRAHDHMMTKNFKTLRAIKYFDNRQDADDYEKWAIHQIKPVLNRKFDTDWSKPIEDWNPSVFGIIAKYKKSVGHNKKSRKSQRVRVPTTSCAVCNGTVGRKRKVVDGRVVHEVDCSPEAKRARHRTLQTQQAERVAKRKEEKSQARQKIESENIRRRVEFQNIDSKCFICGVATKAANRIYIKDALGNKAIIHKACIPKKKKAKRGKMSK